MNDSSPIDPKIQLVADVVFKELISAIRSQDVNLSFYSMELEAQKATESDYRRFAEIYAGLFVKKYKEMQRRSSIEISKNRRRKLVIRCLKKAWEMYQDGRPAS